MSNSSEASGMSASFSGGGLFRISEMFRRTFLLHPLCCKKGSLFVFDDGVVISMALSTDELRYFVHSPLLVTLCCFACVCCKKVNLCLLVSSC